MNFCSAYFAAWVPVLKEAAVLQLLNRANYNGENTAVSTTASRQLGVKGGIGDENGETQALNSEKLQGLNC